jgi:gustatory receptor
MVSAFVQVTMNTSHAIILGMEQQENNLKFIHIVISVMCWALTQFFLLFCVTGSCNAASGEANRSAVLLQKLLLTELHPDTAEEVQLFLQQVSNRKVRFRAWDFFTINYTALGSIVGAITTLLVILVQIQNAN